MTGNPLIPGPHQTTQQVVRVPYQQEQYQEQQKQTEPVLSRETPKPHDPYWNTRIFSVQHIRDCQEGKQFSWLWTPVSELFTLSQVMFVILPVAAYANSHGSNLGIRGLILLSLSLQLALSGGRKALVWYQDWRFSRIPYRVIHR